MTNKHDEEDPSKDCNPRLAALLAVHLVSQVLDEAYVIANAAQDSGQPWRYISMLKNYKTNEIGFTGEEDESLEASTDENGNENNVEVVANIVATSTPQKNAAGQYENSDETLTAFNDSTYDSTLIGQGDEAIEIQHNDFNNSTSMFINRLFDMSDVERILCDDSEIAPTSSEPNKLLAEAMNKVMDSYIPRPPDVIPAAVRSFIGLFPSTEDLCMEQNANDNVESAEILSSDQSEYSFLADAFMPVEFYNDEESPPENAKVYKSLETPAFEKITEDVVEKEREAIKQKNDFELYEKAYMTLNRDYDQCSEDDGYPILQDPKELILQEVELLTANTSNEELRYPKASVSKLREEEATVSGVSGSRRNTGSQVSQSKRQALCMSSRVVAPQSSWQTQGAKAARSGCVSAVARR